MEHRFLGDSGFKVPVLGLGTGTFGGKGPLFSAWGSTDVDEAKRLVDICLEVGVNLFDTADVYSAGASEFILGAAIKGRRDDVLLSAQGRGRTTSAHRAAIFFVPSTARSSGSAPTTSISCSSIT